MPAGTRGGGQCGRRSGRKRRIGGARVPSKDREIVTANRWSRKGGEGQKRGEVRGGGCGGVQDNRRRAVRIPRGWESGNPGGRSLGGSSWLESPEGSVVGARSGHELAHARHAPPGMRKLMPSPRRAGREPAHARQRACGQQTSKRQGMRHGKQTYQRRCGKQKQGTRHDKQTINAGTQSVRGRAADKVAGSTCRLYGPQC